MEYTCPMHPEIRSNQKAKCPKCGMDLVPVGGAKEANSYSALFIILGLILLVTIIFSLRDYYSGNFLIKKSMAYFESGFFLVFSGFKFLDIRGFAGGYSTYDLLASKVVQYGYVYPFIELAFGIGYLIAYNSPLLNSVVIVVMGFSGIGVLNSILKKRKIQCACLGTVIKLPLNRITLIEDFGMVLMAAAILALPI